MFVLNILTFLKDNPFLQEETKRKQCFYTGVVGVQPFRLEALILLTLSFSVDKRGWIERKANAEPSHPALSDNVDTSVGGITAVADLLTQQCEGWKPVG